MKGNFEQGKWYLMNYGFEQVTGRCVDVLPDGCVFSFRWGGPFRERNYVASCAVIGEVSDPRLLSRFAASTYALIFNQ